MKKTRTERIFITTLLCIWIGGALIVAADVFLFSKKANVLWHDTSAQRLADVTDLRAQHSKYMNEGVIPAHSKVQSVNALASYSSIDEESEIEQKMQLAQSEDLLGENENSQTIDDIISMAYATELAEVAPAAGHPADQLQPFYKPLSDPLGPVEQQYTRPQAIIEAPITRTTQDSETGDADQLPETEEQPVTTIDEARIAPVTARKAPTVAPKPKAVYTPKKTSENIEYIAPQGQGLIAIIIDDMGPSLRSKLFEIMQYPLTLSYLPNAKDLPERIARARSNGHEIMLHMPMQPYSDKFNDGTKMLRVEQTDEEFEKTLSWALERIGNVAGINNHMGSKLTKDTHAMNLLMQHIKDKDMFFIDSKTIGSSVAAKTAQAYGIPYAERDIFLDHEITDEFINKQLMKLEHIARTKGYGIAIAHPHAKTLNALKAWLPQLEEKGLTLVPASRLINRPIEKDHVAQHSEQRAF